MTSRGKKYTKDKSHVTYGTVHNIYIHKIHFELEIFITKNILSPILETHRFLVCPKEFVDQKRNR